MLTLRTTLIALSALFLGSGAVAVPIQQFSQLPATDRAQIDKSEAAFFDSVEELGTEQGLLKIAKEMGAAEKITTDLIDGFRQIDQKCGKLTTVERFKTENFGSRVIRETFVATHGSCFIRWDLTYVKRGASWSLDRFNFLTFDGNVW